ncbi:MAG: pantetheine-phosphate adenylyltransferase [Candidatus Lokiarchaeota archaeon]|nr:pantetheine-phosphate adenylyltransferase [Candidatus Lokiarchaeota archaeon]
MINIFNLIGLGGTFDHLHKGHKFLIKIALNLSKNIVIGLATDELLRNKEYASTIENYEIRKKNIIEYIKNISDPKRVKIIELNDSYGPPIKEREYEAIIVSQETYLNAIEINKIREKKGFDQLIIIVIPVVKDDKNEKISSTNIRKNLVMEK